MFRRIILSNEIISLFLHALKLILALAINWIILEKFSAADYVIWAVASSILVVATASDLGIGQYTITQLIHKTKEKQPQVIIESLTAITPLAVLSVVFVYIALQNQPEFYKVVMALFIGLRVLSIPFGAVLNAVNKFKLRKAIEVGVFGSALVLISWVAHTEQNVRWALLSLNCMVMVGGLVTVLLALRYVSIPVVDVPRPSLASLTRVYRVSTPFLVNNLTGLLTYGGFVWVSSFLLPTSELAKLSVLHTFVLVNVYQLYDVTLRARQADLIRPEHIYRTVRIYFFLSISCPILTFMIGGELLPLFIKEIPFSATEVGLFAVFLSIELGFLLIQSIAQVNKQLSQSLTRYAVIKFSFQLLAIAIFWLIQATALGSLLIYLLLLSIFSLVGYLICYRNLFSKLRTLHE